MIDGGAFTGEGTPDPKGNWLRTEEAEAALSRIRVRGLREPRFRAAIRAYQGTTDSSEEAQFS